MPSQIMEQWMNESYILEMIGKHYITNERLSDNLIDKILEEKKIFAGVTYMKLLYQSLLSLNYYTDTKYILDNNYSQDLYKSLVTNVDFKDIHTNIEYGFLHLSGYYAAYYNYLWSQVFTIDIYNNIKENGGLLNVNFGKRFANMILSKGGSLEPNILVENYLGRPFKIEPFFDNLEGKN
jgi:Zn-dependent oligopeptidase